MHFYMHSYLHKIFILVKSGCYIGDNDGMLHQPQGVERAEGDRPIGDMWL
jgi:hypothetical protein